MSDPLALGRVLGYHRSHQFHMHRRQVLIGLGWLAGGAIASIPRNGYAPSMPVAHVQAALEQFGYLPPGHVTGVSDPLYERTLYERALIRFKRHAQRPYRLTRAGMADDQPLHACFAGPCDARITVDTIFEIKQWVERGWKLPLHRFKFASLSAPGEPTSYALRWSILREDAALVWRELMKEASGRGATLAEPYGDTFRALGQTNKTGGPANKTGTSRRSLHHVGRAVDLNQTLAQGGLAQGARAYYLSREDDGARTRFRIYCKTAKQDGSQGKYRRLGAVQCWKAGAGGLTPLPQGWYVDLTDLLATGNFERIAAHEGWQRWDILSEWWHYQYSVAVQPTFLDECELIGIGEKQLLGSGYTVDEMDQSPG